jgi:nucleoside-diphosphate-sugar epimerase
LGGDNITFRRLYELLAELSDRGAPRFDLPKWALVAAAATAEQVLRPFGAEFPLSAAYARGVIGRYGYYDSSRAIGELGYTIPPACESLLHAVRGERKRLAGAYALGFPQALPSPRHGSRTELPTLLITGATGWLGSRFIHALAGTDRRVRLLVEPRLADLIELPEPFEVIAGDICDREAVSRALEGVHTVFHLAGAIYPSRIRTLYRVNTEGMVNLVDQCITMGVRRILSMGTDSISGHGTTERRVFDEHTPNRPYRHYGRSKWLAERYLLEKTREGLIDGTSLRGFWFFGPGAPPRQQKFLEMLRWRRQIVFGDGSNFRSISHVDNVVAAFLAAEGATASYGKWYWIADPVADYTVAEIYSRLCAAIGSEFRPIRIPEVVSAFLRLVDTLLARFGRLHGDIHAAGKAAFDIAGEIDAAQREFGFAPALSLRTTPEAYIS